MQETLILTPPAPEDKWERMMRIAIERGSGAEQFAMLVDAITKAKREDARLQFEAALGRFKEHLPSVFKNKKVSFPTKDGGKTEYHHAELEVAAEICADELRKEGLIHTWRPSEGANGRTVMSCVFRHSESGHVEDMATLGGPPETSGSKNGLQAIGSTVTYLQRYTLLAACGIAPKGMDDDGRGGGEGMTENAITDYAIQMRDATKIGPQDEKGSLQFIFAECYAKANRLGDKSARDRFIKLYEEKKRELRGVAK
jgi:ERF superfamily